MKKGPQLPCLPGYSVNHDIGQTKFHLSNYLEHIHEGVPYFTSKMLPAIGGGVLPGDVVPSQPSTYVRGEVPELPAWIVFDKHILKFNAFFLESVAFPQDGSQYMVHKCEIYYYLEDGTVKVVERKVRNSGLPQGCLVSRQRIRFSLKNNTTDYLNLLDFNVGKEVEIYGKKFTLVNCDKFTRQFLNRLGIQVPDPIVIPEDPYMQKREKMDGVPERKNFNKTEAFEAMNILDNRILGFKAYWDDRGSHGGYLHLLKLSFFLGDGTIEVLDVTDPDNHTILVKRMRLVKEYKGLTMPGDDSTTTLLNVIGDGKRKNRYLVDPLGGGISQNEFYRDKDIVIGAVINSFGRQFVVYDCDNYTKDYYRVKFGLDEFTPLQRPLTKEEEADNLAQNIGIQIAPHNGFGSYEDSLRNCLSIQPAHIVKSMKQFYEKDKCGYDSKILRFSAVMISKDPIFNGRRYIVSYFLSDDSLNIFDGDMNSNSGGRMLISRRQIMKPNQNIFSTKPPEYYTYADFYVGNTVEIEKQLFRIVGADDYTLRYMENHPDEFPKSNVRIIVDKVRQAVRPNYKEFASQFMTEPDSPIPFLRFREALLKILTNNDISEHEIITLARHNEEKQEKDRCPLEIVRRHAHDILKRELFDDFQALKEGFLHKDVVKSAYVNIKDAYPVLRGAKIPLDSELVQFILTKLAEGPDCLIDYNRLIEFLNYKAHVLSPIQPVSISGVLLGQRDNRVETDYSTKNVMVGNFINDLQLENDLRQQHV